MSSEKERTFTLDPASDAAHFKTLLQDYEKMSPEMQAGLLKRALGVVIEWVSKMPLEFFVNVVNTENRRIWLQSLTSILEKAEGMYANSEAHVDKLHDSLTDTRDLFQSSSKEALHFMEVIHSPRFQEAVKILQRLNGSLKMIALIEAAGFSADNLAPILNWKAPSEDQPVKKAADESPK